MQNVNCKTVPPCHPLDLTLSPGAFIQGEFSSLDGDCPSDYLVFKELGIDNARALYSGDYSVAAHLSLLGIVFPRVPGFTTKSQRHRDFPVSVCTLVPCSALFLPGPTETTCL